MRRLLEFLNEQGYDVTRTQPIDRDVTIFYCHHRDDYFKSLSFRIPNQEIHALGEEMDNPRFYLLMQLGLI